MITLIAIIAAVICLFGLAEIFQSYLSDKKKRESKQREIDRRLKQLGEKDED